MRSLFIIVLIVFFSGHLVAQSEGELKASGQSHFRSGNFEAAKRDYLSLLTLHPRDVDYNYHYGICILKVSSNKIDALRHLDYVVRSGDAPNDAYYYLGLLYHLNYQFDKAIKYYQIYQTKEGASKKSDFDVRRQIEMCQNGKQLLKEITDVRVIEKKEFRESDFFRLYDEKNLNGNILVSALDQQKADRKRNFMPVIFYPSDSKNIFFASYGEKDSGQKDIYFKTKTDAGWSAPMLVKGDVNSNYDEDFPYFDDINQILYFSSRGHNSMGGYDIFSAQYDSTNQVFSKVKNMDFAISSTDDDLFYIPNSDHTSAWFASSRNARLGFLNVYRVSTQRYPATIAFINLSFESQAFPDNHNATVKLIKVSNNQEIGTYHSDENGTFSIPIYFSGDYEYQLSIYGIQKTFTLNFSFPKLSNLTEYRQKIIHKRIDYKDYAELLFLREGEISPDDARIAEFIRNKSHLDVNRGTEEYQNEKSEIHDTLNGAKNILDDKIALEAKINQKIVDNTNQIVGTQYDLKSLVAKQGLQLGEDKSMTKEAHQKVIIIKKLSKQNEILKQLSDSIAIVNNKNRDLLGEFKASVTELDTVWKKGESLSEFRTKNSNLLEAAKKVIADNKRQGVFNRYDLLKEQIASAKEGISEKEKELNVQQSELATLEEQYATAKPKDKALVSSQITEQRQLIQQTKNQLNYLNQKRSDNESQIQTLQSQKDLIFDISQTNLQAPVSREEVTKKLNDSKEIVEKYLPINKLIEKHYEDQNKSNELSVNDLTTVAAQKALTTFKNLEQNPNASKQELDVARDMLVVALKAEQKTLKANLSPNITQNESLEKIENKLNSLRPDEVVNKELTNTITIGSNNGMESADHFIQKKYPELKHNLELSIKQNDSSQVNKVYNQLYTEVRAQIQAQKNLVEANPKNKELATSLARLEQIKQEIIRAKSNWELTGLRIGNRNSPDKEEWTEELLPDYNMSVQSISNQIYDNDIDKVTDLLGLEKRLLDKINAKKNTVSNPSLDSLAEDVQLSINNMGARIDVLGQKSVDEVLESNEEIQKAIEKMDLSTNDGLFNKQVDDLNRTIEEKRKSLSELKKVCDENWRPSDYVDDALEELNKTSEILDAKVNEHEQYLAVQESESNEHIETASNHPLDSDTNRFQTSENNNVTTNQTNATQPKDNKENVANQVNTTQPIENNSNIATNQTNATQPKDNKGNVANQVNTTQPIENNSNIATNQTNATQPKDNKENVTNQVNTTQPIENNSNIATNQTNATQPKDNKGNVANQVNTTQPIENNSNIATNQTNVAQPKDNKEEVVNQVNTTQPTIENNNITVNNPEIASDKNSKGNSDTIQQPNKEVKQKVVLSNRLLIDMNNPSISMDYKKSEGYNKVVGSIKKVVAMQDFVVSNNPPKKTEISDLRSILNSIQFNDEEKQNYLSNLITELEKKVELNPQDIGSEARQQLNFVSDELTFMKQKERLSSLDVKDLPEEALQKRLLNLRNEKQRAESNLYLLASSSERMSKKERARQSAVKEALSAKLSYLFGEIAFANVELSSLARDKGNQDHKAKLDTIESILVNLKNINTEQVVLHQTIQNDLETTIQIDRLIERIKMQILQKEDTVGNHKMWTRAEVLNQIKDRVNESFSKNYNELLAEIANPTQPSYVLQSVQKQRENHQEVVDASFQLVPNKLISADQIKSILSSKNYPKGLFFRVQVGAFVKPLAENVYRDFSPVTMENLHNGIVKYMAGYFTDEQNAVKARDEIRFMGFGDAFLVAYCDGQRIPVYEARRRLAEGTCLPVTDRELMFHIDSAKALQMPEEQVPTITQNKDNAPSNEVNTTVQKLPEVYFTVQIGVFNRYVEAEVLKGLKPINTDAVAANAIRYSVGRFDNLDSARKQRLAVIPKGFTDAFIVAYYQGKRITVQEALDLLAQNKAKLIQRNADTLSVKEAQPTVLTNAKNYRDEMQELINIRKQNVSNNSSVKAALLKKMKLEDGYTQFLISSNSTIIPLNLYWWLLANTKDFDFAKTDTGMYVSCKVKKEDLQDVKSNFVNQQFATFNLEE